MKPGKPIGPGAASARASAPIPPQRAGAASALLLGALVGSLVAGRLETGVLCLLVALGAAASVHARAPTRGWMLGLGVSSVASWILNLYLTPGVPISAPELLGKSPTQQGLRLGTLLVLRLAGALASVQGLRAVWTAEAAVDQASRWLGPLRRLGLPVGEVRTMLALALRFVPLLKDESVRIARVQDLRAGRRPRGAQEWLQRRRAAVVPTLVGALERAERVALALEARHYRTRPTAVATLRRGPPSGLAWKLGGVTLAGAALLWRG
jgi:energy-coupling factor transporter transmembrane protein EcfT